MYHRTDRIANKPDDYKLCKECNTLNWYENDSCINCDSNKFKKIGKRFLKRFEEDYESDFELEV